MIPSIITTGTVDVTAGSKVVTGTGTAWSVTLDRGALLFVGAEERPAIVASRRVRSTDTADSIANAPAGTFVEDAELYLLDDWHGSTAEGASYRALVFGGSAEINEALVRLLSELGPLGLVGVSSGVPDPGEGRENEVRIDPDSKTIFQRVAGVWTAIVTAGMSWDAFGNVVDRDAHDGEAEGFTYFAVDEGGFYIKLSADSADWSALVPLRGATGQGERGWSPTYAIATDGDRRVMQLTGYVGGEGDEPTAHVGEYVGSTGYVVAIGDAVDTRGATGPLPEVTVGTVTTVAPGVPAAVTPTPTEGGVSLSFDIPRGADFRPDAIAADETERDTYGEEAAGFAVLVSAPEAPLDGPHLFFLVTPDAVSPVWSDGVPFGQGGSPADAEYLLGASAAELTGGRVVTNTDTIEWDLTTPGAAKAALSAATQATMAATSTALAELWTTTSLLALEAADTANVALFLGDSGNRVADSFATLDYVDVANATNLDASDAGVLKPAEGVTDQTLNAADGTASFSPGYTLFNLSTALTNGDVIARLGLYSTDPQSVVLKIALRPVASSFTIVVSQALSHPGGGWADVPLASDYTVPGSGSYVAGAYMAADSVDAFTSGLRGFKAGDQPLGAGSGYTENAGGAPAMRAWKRDGTVENLTVASEDFAAETAPAAMKVLALVEEVDAVEPDTDYTMEVSRDGGATWAAAPLTDRFTIPTSGLHVVESAEVDVSGQPSGTAPRWRFKTLNNDAVELHAAHLYWR